MSITVSVQLSYEQKRDIPQIRELARREKAAKVSEGPGKEDDPEVSSIITCEFAHPKRAIAFMKGMLESYGFVKFELSYTY